MPEYSVALARSATKELARLDSTLLARVLSKIEALAENPRPLGCAKLTGSEDLWRIRIGDYRAIYSVEDK